MLDHVPLGQSPALHPLRQSWRPSTFVQGLTRYDGAVRLPAPVHHRRIPWVHGADLASLPGQRQGLPGSAHSVSVHARGLRPPPGPSPPGQSDVYGRACCVFGARRHPGVARLRGSILCRHVPLSTLRRHRYRRLHMTRGQCGWLDLHRQGLAPFTTVPACPGAYPNDSLQPPLSAVGCERVLDGPFSLLQLKSRSQQTIDEQSFPVSLCIYLVEHDST